MHLKLNLLVWVIFAVVSSSLALNNGTRTSRGEEQTNDTQSQIEVEDALEEKESELNGQNVTADEQTNGEVEGEEVNGEKKEEEEHEAPSGYRDPKPCEVCKYLALELEGRLAETGKVKDFIETGHGIMPGDRKRKPYTKSELRLIEAVHEPHVCDKLLTYDVHAEHRRSLRYAKGPSETRRTLNALVDKGVNVELGIPQEMWRRNSPSNEISYLQRLCVDMVERHEEAIEDWYWGHQELSLLNYLCRDRALRDQDSDCLTEKLLQKGKEQPEEKGSGERNAVQKEQSDKKKGDTGTSRKSAMPPLEPTPVSLAESVESSETTSSSSKPSHHPEPKATETQPPIMQSHQHGDEL